MAKQPAKPRPAARTLLSALAVALALCFGLACGARVRPRPRTVLVVVLDSLHAGRLNGWGGAGALTPHLGDLAARGVLFESAYSQSSWTLPSVASLFTSLEQEQHGLRRLEGSLPSGPDTLAELFARAGYRTRAWVQTPVLASARGLDRGFQQYEVLGFGNAAAEEAVERARQALSASGQEDLFAYVHLAPPHMPYEPPQPFALAQRPEAQVDGSIASCRRVHRAGLEPDHPDVLRLAQLYDAHVTWADALLGRLLEALPQEGTWVAVTSDHGEAFMQHGAQGHNAQVHEEMLHVPLVVAGPGIPQGEQHAVAVSLLDLLPTLVETCRLDPPRQAVQGRTLGPLLRGEAHATDARTLRFSSRYKDDASTLQLGLRVGAEKLVLAGPEGRAQLFDLNVDPDETRDLARENPARTQELRRLLIEWHAARVPAVAPGPAPNTREREDLRRLGYGD